MTHIKILCVGRLKEPFYAAACAEYIKRLSKTASVEIVEVPDEKAPETLSDAQKEQVKRAEGERLLAKLKPGGYNIALAIEGKQLTSEQFARKLSDVFLGGKSCVNFIIGGSLGLHSGVLQSCDMLLSFSRFTFCHQLMRAILLEQVYRAYKINAGEPYHK